MRRSAVVAAGFLAGLLAVALIEGVSSYLLLAVDVVTTHAIAERRHTKYDPELGWVNEPDIDIQDMYGPGVYLKTNHQGFRRNTEVAATVPAGKRRLVCSGDSYTLGYGVDNDHTWCQLLTALNPALETVNMGQGGYGADQAYLWYIRDAVAFDAQVHLFAVILDDFGRMQGDTFWGYGKPVLALKNDALVVRNVPVPERSFYSPWVTTHLDSFRALRTVRLLARAPGNLGWLVEGDGGASTDASSDDPDLRMRRVLAKLFVELKAFDDARGRALAFVLLPDPGDLSRDATHGWEAFLAEQARALGVPLINVMETVRSVPTAERGRLFIPVGRMAYPGSEGHLTEEGNALAARIISERLAEEPSLARALPGAP